MGATASINGEIKKSLKERILANENIERILQDLYPFKFVDDEFLPSNEQLGRLCDSNREVIWLRPSEFSYSNGHMLSLFDDARESNYSIDNHLLERLKNFHTGINNTITSPSFRSLASPPASTRMKSPTNDLLSPRSDELLNGVSLDEKIYCYYLLSLLSCKPIYDYIAQDCFVFYNATIGICGIKLWIHNKQELIVIDDYIPCYADTRMPCYSYSKLPCAWLPLLEKGLAKLYGGYHRISCNISELLRDVNGGHMLTVHMEDIHKSKELTPTEMFHKFHREYCCSDTIIFLENRQNTELNDICPVLLWNCTEGIEHCPIITSSMLNEDEEGNEIEDRPTTATTTEYDASETKQLFVSLLQYKIKVRQQTPSTQKFTKKQRNKKGKRYAAARGKDTANGVVSPKNVSNRSKYIKQYNYFQEAYLSWPTILTDYHRILIYRINSKNNQPYQIDMEDQWYHDLNDIHHTGDNSCGGSIYLPTWRNNPIYRLTINSFGQCVARKFLISLIQKVDYATTTTNDYHAIGLTVCLDDPTLSSVMLHSDYHQYRDISLECTIAKEITSILIIPSMFQCNINQSFILSVSYLPVEETEENIQLSCPIALERVIEWSEYPYIQHIHDEWNHHTCQGRIAPMYPQCHQNPSYQFKLHISPEKKKKNILIRLCILLTLQSSGEDIIHKHEDTARIGCYVMTNAAHQELHNTQSITFYQDLNSGYLGKFIFQPVYTPTSTINHTNDHNRLKYTDNHSVVAIATRQLRFRVTSCRDDIFIDYSNLVIMPTTFDSGYRGKYEMTVLCNEEFELNRMISHTGIVEIDDDLELLAGINDATMENSLKFTTTLMRSHQHHHHHHRRGRKNDHVEELSQTTRPELPHRLNQSLISTIPSFQSTLASTAMQSRSFSTRKAGILHAIETTRTTMEPYSSRYAKGELNPEKAAEDKLYNQVVKKKLYKRLIYDSHMRIRTTDLSDFHLELEK